MDRKQRTQVTSTKVRDIRNKMREITDLEYVLYLSNGDNTELKEKLRTANIELQEILKSMGLVSN